MAARVGLVGYDVALELAKYLSVDDNHTPWKAFTSNARYIDHMMIDSADYSHWQVVYSLSLYGVITVLTRHYDCVAYVR